MTVLMAGSIIAITPSRHHAITPSRRLDEHAITPARRARHTLCAAPSYLAERGEPMTLADLAEHEGIAYLRQGRVLAWQWQLDGQWLSVRPTGRLQLDDLHVITQAAIAGFGLAWLPAWLARPHLERGAQREVLGSLKGRRYPINALWPHSPHLPLKTRMAIDWLASWLPERLACVAVAAAMTNKKGQQWQALGGVRVMQGVTLQPCSATRPGTGRRGPGPA
ncbi:LysR substrate-binding domain-containing protein [Aeromonas simiae]|uniref:LysR substrate-binding domain-containing protein n=2 Tax=Aeromonas simiae TaxID=218936 RepID=UPI00345E2E56